MCAKDKVRTRLLEDDLLTIGLNRNVLINHVLMWSWMWFIWTSWGKRVYLLMMLGLWCSSVTDEFSEEGRRPCVSAFPSLFHPHLRQLQPHKWREGWNVLIVYYQVALSEKLLKLQPHSVKVSTGGKAKQLQPGLSIRFCVIRNFCTK